MYEPDELRRLLREHHLPLGEEDSRTLAVIACGYSAREAAQGLFRSERTVRAEVARLLELICFPCGARRSPAVAGWWFLEHATCERRTLVPRTRAAVILSRFARRQPTALHSNSSDDAGGPFGPSSAQAPWGRTGV